jgi:DNA-binding ferritin-like protein
MENKMNIDSTNTGSFKRFLSEADESEVTEVNYISFALYAIAQLHIFHWLTRNGTEHEALGEFYEGLQEELDGFVERFMGKYGDLPEDTESFEFTFEFSEEALKDIIMELDDLTSEVIQEFDETDDASVIDALVDIKELIDTLRYKLRLD